MFISSQPTASRLFCLVLSNGRSTSCAFRPSLLNTYLQVPSSLAARRPLELIFSFFFKPRFPFLNHYPLLLHPFLSENSFLQALSSLAASEKASLQQPILELLEQLMSSSPEDYLSVDALLRDSAAELGLSELRLILHQDSELGPVESVDDASLQAAYRALGALAKRAGPEGQARLVPQLLAKGLRALETVPVSGGALAATGEFLGVLAGVVGGGNREQILGGLVESLSELAEKEMAVLGQSAGRERRPSTSLFETGEAVSPASDAEARLPVVLSVLGSVARGLLGEASKVAQQALHRSVGVLRASLANPSTVVQSTGLQTIRNALQAAAGDRPKDAPEGAWARTLARELTQNVCGIVHAARSTMTSSDDVIAPMTSAFANVLGDCLKVLVLLHSVAEGSPAQEEVLTVLLATVIAAATPPPRGHNPASSGLASLAVKLVTHLATVPATAAQFKGVVASLPPETKQQLQAVLRAQSAAVTAPQEQQGRVTAPPKLVVPLPLKGFAPPPSTGTGIRVAVPQKAPKEEDLKEDWGDDDGWAEAKVATSAGDAVENEVIGKDDEVQEKEGNGAAQVASAADEFDEDDWGDEFESAPPAAADVSTPAEGGGEPADADVSNQDDVGAREGTNVEEEKAEPAEADVSKGDVEGTRAEEKEEKAAGAGIVEGDVIAVEEVRAERREAEASDADVSGRGETKAEEQGGALEIRENAVEDEGKSELEGAGGDKKEVKESGYLNVPRTDGLLVTGENPTGGRSSTQLPAESEESSKALIAEENPEAEESSNVVIADEGTAAEAEDERKVADPKLVPSGSRQSEGDKERAASAGGNGGKVSLVAPSKRASEDWGKQFVTAATSAVDSGAVEPVERLEEASGAVQREGAGLEKSADHKGAELPGLLNGGLEADVAHQEATKSHETAYGQTHGREEKGSVGGSSKEAAESIDVPTAHGLEEPKSGRATRKSQSETAPVADSEDPGLEQFSEALAQSIVKEVGKAESGESNGHMPEPLGSASKSKAEIPAPSCVEKSQEVSKELSAKAEEAPLQ
jgi:hypothetical protein